LKPTEEKSEKGTREGGGQWRSSNIEREEKGDGTNTNGRRAVAYSGLKLGRGIKKKKEGREGP